MPTTAARITRRALAGLAILLPLLLLVTALAAGVCGQTWATLASSPLLVADTTPTAVCDTDTSCATWSLEHGESADPLVDDRGEPFCLPGASLYDTEQPAVGDEGVVCTPDAQPSSQAVSQPAEDSPTFDCSTMGNLQCGTGVVGGPYSLPMPAGTDYLVCPTGGRLEVNQLDVTVCSYGQST